MSKNTRSAVRSSVDWLLGDGINRSLSYSNKLPLNRVVMKRFLFLRHENKTMPIRQLFTVIFEELKEIWKKAFLPMKEHNKGLDQLVLLHKEWLILSKIQVCRRKTTATLTRIKLFQDNMDKLCDFCPKDVLERLKSKRYQHWQEDYDFLLGQRKFPQIGFIAGIDKLMLEQEKRMDERQQRYTRNSKSNYQSEDESTSREIDDDSSIPDTTETIDEDSRPPSCSRPSSVTLDISTNSMAKQTAQVALSRGLSVRDHVSMQASFVKSGGCNVNDFVMSVSTTWRHKQQNLKEVYEKIREEWIKPNFSVIHFDSKLIKYV